MTSPPEQTRSALAEALELVRHTSLRSYASLRDEAQAQPPAPPPLDHAPEEPAP